MDNFEYKVQHIQQLLRQGKFDELETKVVVYKAQTSTIEEKLIFEFYSIAAQINEHQYFDFERIAKLQQADHFIQDTDFKLRFKNLYGLVQLNQQNYSEASNTFCELLKILRKDYRQNASLFATTLGNAIYLYNLLGRYKDGIRLYKSIDHLSLEFVQENYLSNYFHILENLLISYIELENWPTALVIADSILAVPTLDQFPAFQAMVTMSYGYIIFQSNPDEGLDICLKVAETTDFSNKGFEYAYKQYLEVLEKSQHFSQAKTAP